MTKVESSAPVVFSVNRKPLEFNKKNISFKVFDLLFADCTIAVWRLLGWGKELRFKMVRGAGFEPARHFWH